MSVIVDGSSDSSITENKMVYIHACQKGEVKTTFIKYCEVQRGTALGVINAIKRSAETVMEFNTFLSAIQMAHSSRSYQNLRHPVPLQQV